MKRASLCFVGDHSGVVFAVNDGGGRGCFAVVPAVIMDMKAPIRVLVSGFILGHYGGGKRPIGRI